MLDLFSIFDFVGVLPCPFTMCVFFYGHVPLCMHSSLAMFHHVYVPRCLCSSMSVFYCVYPTSSQCVYSTKSMFSCLCYTMHVFHYVNVHFDPALDIYDRLVGQVVKTSAPKAEGSEFESRLRRDFSWSSHTSDLKIGTLVATLPGAWRYRVGAGTGWPGVTIL